MHEAVLLHLSDLHFGGDWSVQQNAERNIVLQSLITTVEKLEASWKPTCICISGDIGWGGKKTDYDSAQQWLQILLSRVELTFNDVIVCPGNHDVFRSDAQRLARPSMAIEADQILQYPLPEHNIAIFKEYSAFCERAGIPTMWIGETPSYLIGERIHDNNRFVTVNSSWFCKDKDDKGKLWIGLPQLRYMESTNQFPALTNLADSRKTVVLLHHPREWLNDNEIHAWNNRPNSFDYLALRCHLLLTGHTHGELRSADRIAESAWHIMAGATYESASHFNCFRLIRIEENSVCYRSFEFDPRSPDIIWREVRDARRISLSGVADGSLELVSAAPVYDHTAVRTSAHREAEKTITIKSRQLRPHGNLPDVISMLVSTRVSNELVEFDEQGRFIDRKNSELSLPVLEACRYSRRTMLFGDLGSGKSTLASKFVVDSLDQNEQALAFLVPVKELRLQGAFRLGDLLSEIDAFICGQIAPTISGFSIRKVLDSCVEVVIAFDGLDELTEELAPRFVVQIASLVDHWPNIQILATARPVELVGVNFDDWGICRVDRLGENAKRALFEKEALADGMTAAMATSTARDLLSILETQPALDELANTPLAVRLLYSKLKLLEDESEAPSLGDLLIDLLLERLGKWDSRDQKSPKVGLFFECFPSPTSKAEILGVLALEATISKQKLGSDHAVRLLSAHVNGVTTNSNQLADEALLYFQHVGAVAVDPVIDFQFQPLKEVAISFALMASPNSVRLDTSIWKGIGWRSISFTATIARRRGQMNSLRQEFQEYVSALLADDRNVAPACYIVSESRDPSLAASTVQQIAALGRRPLTWHGDERTASSRAIAEVISLAGDIGFDWLFDSYLDPRYPLVNRGSAVISAVLRQWAALVKLSLTSEQKARLTALVEPYLAHRGFMRDVLHALAILVPESFLLVQRLWLFTELLDDRLFRNTVSSEIRKEFHEGSEELVNAILCHHAVRSFRATQLFLELNTGELPIDILKSIFSVTARRTMDVETAELQSRCFSDFEGDKLLTLLRWSLSEPNQDSKISTGCALLLFDRGESRLSIIGQALLSGLHDGGYVPRAEEILSELIGRVGPSAVHWLASNIINFKDALFGAHSGWWRLLLKWIHLVGDEGPGLLLDCVHSVGPYLLARHPEVRHALRVIVEDSRYRSALFAGLSDIDPKVRFGTAMILTTCDPAAEGCAIYSAIKSRSSDMLHGYYEWELFFQSLRFSYSTLEFLHGKMPTLGRRSRALAMAVLCKHNFKLTRAEQSEAIQLMLQLESHSLDFSNLLTSEPLVDQVYLVLLDHMDSPSSFESGKAANILLSNYQSRLSSIEIAKCWLVATADWFVSADSVLSQMNLVTDDHIYRESISEASRQFADKFGQTFLLGKVADAVVGKGPWKDVVIEVLCSGTGLRLDIEDRGLVLLEYGRQSPKHSVSIGEAAKELLNDQRILASRRIDALHWLAVVADEFSRLTPEELEDVLLQGPPIEGSATRALLARLGRTPDRLPTLRDSLSIPTLKPILPPVRSKEELVQSLISSAVSTENLKSSTCSIIENTLVAGVLSDDVIENIERSGLAGTLIAEALRFCLGRQSSFGNRIQLLRNPITTAQNSDSSCLKRLYFLEKIGHAVTISESNERKLEYIIELDAALVNNHWSASIAVELLSERGNLLPFQIAPVFNDFAEFQGVFHEALADKLVDWLATRSSLEARDNVALASKQAIQTLDESGWNSNDGGIKRSPYPYLIFPLALWTHSDDRSEAGYRVFLRGVKFLFQEAQPSPIVVPAQVLSTIEPLLVRVAPEVLAAVLQKAALLHDPAIRGFAALLRAMPPLSNGQHINQ